MRIKSLVLGIWRGFMAWPLERRIVVVVFALAAVLLADWLHDTRDSWRTAVAERIADGKKPALKHDFRTGMWYGTLWTCGILALAAATSRWWLRRLPAGWRPGLSPRMDARARLRFWVMVALAVLVACALRWPRMDESVYVDEEHTLRAYMHGQFVDDAGGGRPVFEPVDWGHGMWRNTIGNNHFLFSITSRVSLDLWRWASGAPRPAFDETAFRMPSLLAGLAGLVVLGLLLARLGFPDAGWLAAWLMALHPWHVRYSAEGRGYALMLVCLLGAMLCAVHALRDARWRWWIGFGTLNFLVMGFFAGAVYPVAALNLALAAALAAQWLHDRSYPLARQSARWIAANVLTATLIIQTMVPWMLEIRSYLVENPRAFGSMGADWYRDVASYLLTGMQWSSDDPANPIIIELSRQWGSAAGVAVLIMLALLALTGGARLWARGGAAARVLVAAFVLAGPLAVAHSILGQRLLFTWYLLYLVPGLCACWAVAVDGLPRPARGAAGLLAAPALAIAGFALLVADQLGVIATHSKEDFRKVVSLMRGDVDVTGESPSHTLLAFSFTEAGLYDPHAATIWSANDVITLMERADRERRPLKVAYAHRALSLERRAAIMALLDDKSLFQEVAIVPGLEEQQFTHHILKYRPGSWTDTHRK